LKQLFNKIMQAMPFKTIEKEAWRIVEDQNRSSTRKMVDTATEHEMLEKLIEESKPKPIFYGDEDAFEGLHYLLSTPFRYPPLKRGTRFGSRHERNLFYTSLDLETAMAEKAFHRLEFLLASKGAIGGKSVNCTAFKVMVSTKNGVDLCEKPFLAFRKQISSRTSYTEPQELGHFLREKKVEAFISYSARSLQNGKNLNIFTPRAFGENKFLEKTFQKFSCYSTKNGVEFYSGNTSINNPVTFLKKVLLAVEA